MSLISFILVPQIVALACSTAPWTRNGVGRYVSQGFQRTYGFSETSSKSAIIGKRWSVEKRGGDKRHNRYISGWAATMQTHSRISSCCVSAFGHQKRAEPIVLVPASGNGSEWFGAHAGVACKWTFEVTERQAGPYLGGTTTATILTPDLKRGFQGHKAKLSAVSKRTHWPRRWTTFTMKLLSVN